MEENFTQRILSLTLEVIHLLTGEEYIVVRKSKDSLNSSRWGRTQEPIRGPPSPSLTPETKNVKKILQVANNLIHLLTGEVLGLEDQEDFCEDMFILEQPMASPDIPNSRSSAEGMHIQIVQEKRGSHRGSKSPGHHKGPKSGQQNDFSPHQGHPLSPGALEFCDIGIGADDRNGLEVTMVQIKEELELWEGLEEDHLAKAESSTPEDLNQCQSYENGPAGVDCAISNSPPLSGTEVDSFIDQCSSTSSQFIPNAKTYKCSECPEVFSCCSELFKHQSHHRGSPLFTCPLCGKNFTSKSNLAKHQKIHTGEKPFSCPECGKRFREKHYLTSHQAVHKGAELILCPQCGKGYTSKSNLAKHQRIHTGQKPFGCSICGKSFNQRSVLIAHQRTHTRENPNSSAQSFTDNLQLLHPQAAHSEGKTFCCNECGEYFSRRDLLLKHLVTHSDGVPD